MCDEGILVPKGTFEGQRKDSQVFVVLPPLIEAAVDKDGEVKASVATCIRDVSKNYPDEVLQTICSYTKNHPKMSTVHIATLLHISETVCRNLDSSSIDHESTIRPLVHLAISQMTASPDLIPDWQLPASQLLVALSRMNCQIVMDGLHMKFEHDILPHYFVIHTLGSLASANSFAMVPYIKTCLGTMLPMMGGLKTEALKQAFAYTFGRFADAIQDYLSNLDQAPDPSFNGMIFNTELSLIIGVLINSWLPASKDAQMLENVLHAIAAIFPLLSLSRTTELAPRLLPGLLTLRRRASAGSTLPLEGTRCLGAVIGQLVTDTSGSAALEPSLDHIFSALSDLVNQGVFEAPDLEQPLTIKNHYEALRCFDTLSKRFPERLSTHLGTLLRAHNEKERARALVVLAHLVSCGHTEHHLPDLTAGVRTLINDSSTKVRRAVVKVVVVLAHKGHIHGLEGANFLSFIINNAISQTTNNPKVEMSQLIDLDELRQVCCDSLVLLSSAAPQVEPLLRPLLLQCLVRSEFSSIAGMLTRCLNSMAARCNLDEGEDFTKNDEELPVVKSPSGQDILARCIVLLGSPLPDCGIHILQFLKTSSDLTFRPAAQKFLDQEVPKLIEQLQGPTWDNELWEDSLLMLVRGLAVTGDSGWILGLAQALLRQGQQQLTAPEVQAQLCSLACLAATSGDAKLAAAVVHDALEAARINLDCEQVCASAISECACGGVTAQFKGYLHHLELVLSQLRLTAKDLQNPAGSVSSVASKFLPNFLTHIGSAAERTKKGELAAGAERLRSAILFSYGYLGRKVPPAELLPKFEATGVVDWMLLQLQATKDEHVRLAALKALGMVAAAFHPKRNNSLTALESRQKVLTLAMAQLSMGKKDVTALALDLATTLIELPPILDADSRLLLIKAAMDKVFECLPDDLSDTSLLSKLDRLCGVAMLTAGITPASLDELLTLLEPWLRSPNLTQRTAAINTLASGLSCYASHLQFGIEKPTTFSISSSIISRAVPRCTDLTPLCRNGGVRCIRLALLITAGYLGRQHSDVERELEEALGEKSLVSDMCLSDPNIYEATVHLSQVILLHLPPQQLGSLVEGLISSLADPEAVSSAGVSVVLDTIIQDKGAELSHHTADILALILRHIPQIPFESTKTGVIHCIATLAQHHPKAVSIALMHQPLPYSKPVQSCWQALAKEVKLAGEVCNCLLSLISSNPLCEEPKDNKSSPRVALPTPLAAVSGLHEMFCCGAEPVLLYASSAEAFPELLATLLLALGGFIGACPPVNMPGARIRASKSTSSLAFVPNRDAYNLVPGRVALQTCHSFLICADLKQAADILSECSHVETGENITSFVGMVPLLIKNIVHARPQVASRLVSSINKHASSTVESARVTVMAVLAELVHWPGADLVLLDGLLQQLTESLDDSSTMVRQIALQGLSHVASLQPQERDRYTSSVLVALLQGLEDSPNEGLGLGLAQEALSGLASILPLVDSKQYLDIQASLALRIQPFFTKDNPIVRASAFRTLGELAHRKDGVAPKAAFREQLTSSLMNLLLGLCDADPVVVKTCKNTLRQVAPLLTAERTAAMLQEHLIEDGCLNFALFAMNLVKIMAEEMPDQFPFFIMTAMGFTRSQWYEVRSSATLLLGLLYSNLPSSQTQHVSLDTMCTRLTQLLVDPHPLVRANASHSISYLFSP